MPTRNASAAWEGGLQGGKGTFNGESGAIGGSYSFGSRFGDSGGTNPEELLAAAEAACFSMALAAGVGEGGRHLHRVQLRLDHLARPRQLLLPARVGLALGQRLQRVGVGGGQRLLGRG